MSKDESDDGRSGRRFGAPKNWRAQFLVALAETSHVTASAKQASIGLSCVYKTRRNDATFARQWLAALCEGYDNLEIELLRRFRAGESSDTAGNKHDNASAIRLLGMHKSDVARARALRDNEDEQAVLDSIDAMIDAMRLRAAANAEGGARATKKRRR